MIAINANALAEADELDQERAEGRVRGPLHGIPVALKDNVHTTHIPTTGGALAFEGFVPPYEATMVTNLREGGAIILAKTVMTELANFMGSGMPGNYRAVGGFGMNPYDPRPDPRDGRNDGRPVMGTGGSSSGIGTAMSFWAANVGTETSGSILSPSNSNMLAAIKPTVGRVSRYGVIPITGDQDIAGPMARTVTDAAIMLGALEGAQPDPNDDATLRCEPPPNGDYTALLRADGLQGARIGIPRASYYDSVQIPGTERFRGGLSDETRRVMDEAIEILMAQGATIVDPANIPSVMSDDRRSGEHPQRDRPGSREQPAHSRGQQCAQLRHETRLQCVARDAGRVRARQDADRAARVEPGSRARRLAQVRSGASRRLGPVGPGGGPCRVRGRSRARPLRADAAGR